MKDDSGWAQPLPRPPRHHRPPKLTVAQWDEIRERYVTDREPARDLAAEFGITAAAIRDRYAHERRGTP